MTADQAPTLRAVPELPDQATIPGAAYTAGLLNLAAQIVGHPSADGLPDALPIARGPITTRNIMGLAPTARLTLDADRLGFHHNKLGNFITVAPADGEGDQRVLLAFPTAQHKVTRLLDIMERALRDDLAGVLHVECDPDGHGWRIDAVWYDDSEGVSW